MSRGDILATYNGQLVLNADYRNSTYYLGWTMTWTQGRTLQTIQLGLNDTDPKMDFVYDSDGLRTKKTYNGVTTTYYRDGTTILHEKRSDGAANSYSYGPDGKVIEASLGDQFVQYVYNAQGDVVMLLDDRGYVLAEYTYDAWGNITVTGTYANTLGKQNPFTYRGAYGYYYDWETGLYYLQSRYYDPQVCRFINADAQLNEGVLGANVFAYCINNPVCMYDSTGTAPSIITSLLSLLYGTSAKAAMSILTVLFGYSKVKTAIWLAASAYLIGKGYTVAKSMFGHSMYRTSHISGSSLINLMGAKMQISTAFSALVKKIKSTLSSSKNAGCTYVYMAYSIEFLTVNGQIDADLYYGIQKASVTVSAWKNKDNTWEVSIKIKDTYDFDAFRVLRYGLNVGNVANDLGLVMQQNGMLSKYSWTYTVVYHNMFI